MKKDSEKEEVVTSQRRGLSATNQTSSPSSEKSIRERVLEKIIILPRERTLAMVIIDETEKLTREECEKPVEIKSLPELLRTIYNYGVEDGKMPLPQNQKRLINKGLLVTAKIFEEQARADEKDKMIKHLRLRMITKKH